MEAVAEGFDSLMNAVASIPEGLLGFIFVVVALVWWLSD